MGFCSECGNNLGSSTPKFCPQCGQALQAPTSAYTPSYNSTTPVPTGSRSISDRYTGSISNSNNVEQSLAEAMGLPGPQSSLYSAQYRGTNTSTSGTCAGCGKPVIGASIQALDKVWHSACFKCSGCGEEFNKTGNTRIVERDGKPWCESCYDKQYASFEVCAACNRTLGSNVIKALGKKWHPECFKCTNCGLKLGGTNKVFNKDGMPYCQNCK